MKRELFIYYRVELHALVSAKTALTAMQTRLRERHPGLSARVLTRDEPDGSATAQTWMETYAADPMLLPTGITPDLQADIEAEAAALLQWIDGARHCEAFTLCAW